MKLLVNLDLLVIILMKLSPNKLFAPAFVGTIIPIAIYAGEMNHHDHHMHNNSNINMNDYLSIY